MRRAIVRGIALQRAERFRYENGRESEKFLKTVRTERKRVKCYKFNLQIEPTTMRG